MHNLTRPIALVLLGAVLASCSDKPAQIRHYSEVFLPGESSGDRNMGGGNVPVTGTEPSGALAWTTPAGWSEQPGTGMRLATFSMVRGGVTGECTLVVLGRGSGEPVSNVKRWIGQMGGDAPADEAIAAFAQAAPRLPLAGGVPAAFYDLTPFAKPDGNAMLTAIAEMGERVVFVKLTAPRAFLPGELEAFKALTSSLRIENAAAVPAAASPPPAMPASAGPVVSSAEGAGPPLHWTTPAGWTEARGTGMRLAAFAITRDGTSAECTIIALGPGSGEPVSNLKRWIGQMGGDMPADDALAAFIQAAPRLPLPGGNQAALYDLRPFARPDGSAMLTAIAAIGERVVFVKLTAAPAVLQAELEAFRTLTASLHE